MAGKKWQVRAGAHAHRGENTASRDSSQDDVYMPTIPKGFSTLQMILGVLVMGLVASAGTLVFLPTYNRFMQESAYQEILDLVEAAGTVRQIEGHYGKLGPGPPGSTNATAGQNYVVTNGYLDSNRYTNGALGELVTGGGWRIGKTGTPPSPNGDKDKTEIFYGFEAAEDCRAVADRVEGAIPRATLFPTTGDPNVNTNAGCGKLAAAHPTGSTTIESVLMFTLE